MPLNTTEKQFESDIAAALLSPAGGYTRNGDCYDPKLGLFVDTLIRFVQKTQPNEWAFFEKQNPVNPVRKFCTAFNNACGTDCFRCCGMGSSTGDGGSGCAIFSQNLR